MGQLKIENQIVRINLSGFTHRYLNCYKLIHKTGAVENEVFEDLRGLKRIDCNFYTEILKLNQK